MRCFRTTELVGLRAFEALTKRYREAGEPEPRFNFFNDSRPGGNTAWISTPDDVVGGRLFELLQAWDPEATEITREEMEAARRDLM